MFILTSVGILVLATTISSCLGIRLIILKRRKVNALRIKLETEKLEAEKEKKEKQDRRTAILEFLPEAMEIGMIAKNPKPVDLE